MLAFGHRLAAAAGIDRGSPPEPPCLENFDGNLRANFSACAGFTRIPAAIGPVMLTDDRIPPSGRKHCHIQGVADVAPAAGDGPPAAHLSGVTVDRRDTDESSDTTAIEPTKFGQISDQSVGGDITDAGNPSAARQIADRLMMSSMSRSSSASWSVSVFSIALRLHAVPSEVGPHTPCKRFCPASHQSGRPGQTTFRRTT
jgi:hypothetical protein